MDEFIGIDWDLPAQHKPSASSFDHRPRAVDAWLKNLPVANIRETSRHLYEALTSVNALQLKAPARLDFLERVRDTVRYTVAGLRREYLAGEFPLPSKQHQVEELSLALIQGLAIGYRAVIQSALRNDGRLPKKRLALAIDRAVRAAAAGVVEGFVVYEPAPAAQWRILHQLYRLAEARQLSTVPIADSSLGQRKHGSIADSYKQILLLSAAGPHRMRQDEVLLLYELLERWAPQARLSAEPASGDGIFAVDLAGEQPPAPSAVNAGGDNQRLLHTAGMLKIMQAELSAPARWQFWRRPTPAHEHAELVRRAMLALGVVPKRRYRRSDSAKRAEVIVGLGRVHRALAQLQGMQAQEHASHFTARDVKNEEERRERDVWELIYPSELLEEHDEPHAEHARRGNGGGAHRWRLVNISAGGYCLLSDPSQSARAQIGELVVIRELDDQQAGYWQTGVIRWMKHVPGEGLQMGVQVLAPNPAAVLLSAEQEDGNFGPEERGLLLPEILPTGQPVSLVSPCLHFASGRRARIKGMGTESMLRLGRQLEGTGSFSQFEFRTAASEDAAAERFESVWSSS